MLSSTDFVILLISIFLGTLLAVGLMVFVSFILAGHKMNKFLTNELNSKTGTLISMLGSATGKQIWKQERASAGGTAKGEKHAAKGALASIIGPDLAQAAELLPPNLKDPLINLAKTNPEMITGFLASMQGMQPAPGTPIAGQVPINEFPKD